jgi:mannose-6-phosphate isomerase-like protein (cupin superfamily)
MKDLLPDVITLKEEPPRDLGYDNHPIAEVNDHVVRISMMTESYPWHFHPNSDETFLVVEGKLVIEFENGFRELSAGQLLTVPRGIRHRTRPSGSRSVNITFESAQTETVMDREPDTVQNVE